MSSTKTRVTAEYIWVHDNTVFSKAKTLEIKTMDELEVKNLHKWHFHDKSGNKHVITPLNVFNCPFRGQNGILIFCESDETNVKSKNTSDLFSIIQEFYILNPNNMRPHGFPVNVLPDTETNYSCSVGYRNNFNRKIMDIFYKLCLASGVKLVEMENSKSPSQWKYKIGECVRNEACVHHWMSKYLLLRVGEISNVIIDLSNTEYDKNGIWNVSKSYLLKNDEKEVEHSSDANYYFVI